MDNTGTAPALTPERMEIKRLTACLAAANAQAEEFERRYYLEVHKVEDLQAQIDTVETPLPVVAYQNTGARDWIVPGRAPDDENWLALSYASPAIAERARVKS